MIKGTPKDTQPRSHLQEVCSYRVEQRINRTAAIQLFLGFPGAIMEVSFHKKVQPEHVIADVRRTVETTPRNMWDKTLKRQLKSSLEGAPRVVRGYHSGQTTLQGRVYFRDLEAGKLIQVDPRTLSSLVLHNVKYTVK